MSDPKETPSAASEPAAAAPVLSRRAALATLSTLAASAVATARPARSEEGEAAAPACRDPQLIPNVVVVTHEGRRLWFLDDLVAKKAVLVHFTSEEAERQYPVLDRLSQVRELLARQLGPRLGEDVLLVSISTDAGPSPHALARLAERHAGWRHGGGQGWLFVSAEPPELAALKARFFEHAHHPGPATPSATSPPDCSRGLFRYGNPSLGLWGSVPAKAEPQAIVERLAWVTPPPAGATAARGGPSRRRGPVPGALLLLALLTSGGVCAAAAPQPELPPDQCQPLMAVAAKRPCVTKGHPHPQPQLQGRTQRTYADGTTKVTTGTSLFPPSYPFVDPPGTNLLPTVYTNNFDSNCVEIPNTLPSTPTVYYNLHDGEPLVTKIDVSHHDSPTTDLEAILDFVDEVVADKQGGVVDADVDDAVDLLRMAVDILEGNPVDRAYSGFPLLHYTGPLKYKQVTPIQDAHGKVIGGNVDIRQIWYDNHIESDTALLDPTAVAEVPWTITYTLDVLDRGKDDFSPFVMYFDAPPDEPFVRGKFGPFLVGMDQTFFPIEEHTRTVLKIKMAPAKYFNLSYTWGWRWHPPRIQVVENATKRVPPTVGPTLLQWEENVFGKDPRGGDTASCPAGGTGEQSPKCAAIGKIGNLAPSKVMWTSFRGALDAAGRNDWKQVAEHLTVARRGFEDWQDRTRLPHGVPLDPTADLTLFYADNTIYAQFTDGGSINFPRFQTRGAQLKVALLNGDYFDHAYMNVDFGGGRGWENQFKSSVKVGGSGCWFTFGRSYVAENLCKAVTVPAATRSSDPSHVLGEGDVLGKHRVEITFASDPSRRLRFYQFDPTHHDVAIMSIH